MDCFVFVCLPQCVIGLWLCAWLLSSIDDKLSTIIKQQVKLAPSNKQIELELK